jgi:NAD(P)H-dependent FMN reductase
MTDSVKILGMAGSLRKGSYNRAALRAATTVVLQGATTRFLISMAFRLLIKITRKNRRNRWPS